MVLLKPQRVYIPEHRHTRIIDCLMACTACLVCFISTVNRNSKKEEKKAIMGCASSGHMTNLKQSICAFRYLCSRGWFVLQKLMFSSNFRCYPIQNCDKLFWSHFVVLLKSDLDVQQTLFWVFFYKSSCLSPTLGVTQFIIVTHDFGHTLLCYLSRT
jgi:hypothetical protein